MNTLGLIFFVSVLRWAHCVSLLDRLENLEHIIDSLRTENRRQQSEIDSLVSQNVKQQSLMDRQQQELDKMMDQCQSVFINRKRLLEGSPEPAIAFSAYLGHTMDHVSNNAIIPFENVTTNEGNDFHGASGVFTCTRNGIYIFAWNLAVDAGHTTHVHFVINGSERRRTAAGGTNHWTASSNVDIVRMAVGDRAWMAVDRPDGQIHPVHTTFTGAFLYP